MSGQPAISHVRDECLEFLERGRHALRLLGDPDSPSVSPGSLSRAIVEELVVLLKEAVILLRELARSMGSWGGGRADPEGLESLSSSLADKLRQAHRSGRAVSLDGCDVTRIRAGITAACRDLEEALAG